MATFETLVFQITVIGISYLIAIFGGLIIIEFLLRFFRVPNEVLIEDGLPRAGKMVGMLERGIILTFGLLGEFGAISFVFVAKSMARFKLLEKRPFAEYYLIGTLASFFFSLIVAILARLILQVEI